MALKYIAFMFQAVLPPAIVAGVGYLTTLPLSEWRWVEYSIAAPLFGGMGMITFLGVWKMASWLQNLILDKYSASP